MTLPVKTGVIFFLWLGCHLAINSISGWFLPCFVVDVANIVTCTSLWLALVKFTWTWFHILSYPKTWGVVIIFLSWVRYNFREWVVSSIALWCQETETFIRWSALLQISKILRLGWGRVFFLHAPYAKVCIVSWRTSVLSYCSGNSLR